MSTRPSKLALVTGASTGIGAAIAKDLAESGFAVLLVARSTAALAEVAGYIQAEGGNAFAVAADLTHPEAAEDIVRAVRETNLELRVVIHNAGIAKVGTVSAMPQEEWEAVLKLNLTAPFRITQKLLPLMKQGSQIIFINSIGGKQAFPEWGAYCASKFGLRAFADSLRQEVRERGIRVTSIFPGAVDTPLHDHQPYQWPRAKMMRPANVATAVRYCVQQPPDVSINEIELESVAGRF